MILRIFVAALFFMFNHAAISADKECYENIDTFLITTYGENYKEDENIDIKSICYGVQNGYWVADKTSGTNYSRTLLIERPKKGVCLALSLPPVASVEAGVLGRSGLPNTFTSIDQAPPGFPSHEVKYLLNLKKYKYQPALCKEVRYVGDKRSERTVSCKTMFGM